MHTPLRGALLNCFSPFLSFLNAIFSASLSQSQITFP